MIADLKPYAEYKESGLPWLGPVPGHWELRRMKSAVMNVIEQSYDLGPDEVYVALEHVESWTGKARPQSDSSLFSGQVKRFRKGDVLFGKLRPYLAKVTRINKDGVCAGEFFVLRPTDSAVSSSYLEHQLRAKHTIDVINGSTFGAKMPRADWQFCGNLPFLLPPPAEQAAIVRFLDWANGRLERAIRAKRKVIALLNEQKQAIIHRAVTRGLDPSVPLKPSGIPWLGDIPQHWERLQLRRVVSFVTSGSRGWANYYSDDGLIFLQSGNLSRSMSLNLSYVQHVRPPDGAEGERTRVRRNDVLICVTGALTGNVAMLDQDLPAPAFVNQHVALVRPKQEMVQPRFLAYVLHSEVGRTQFKTTEYGGTKQGLGLGDVKSVFIPVPRLAEQGAICAHLDAQVARFKETISRLEREIELLGEYRTRLVADIVTGKLDVREAAARLPDEAPLDAVEDDTDPSLDPEAAEGETAA
jgi:type I restriction enzyme S subunit